jgi:hypothetical protein
MPSTAQRKTTRAKAQLKLHYGLAASATCSLTSVVRPREPRPASRALPFFLGLPSGTRAPARHVFGSAPASYCTLPSVQPHPELAVT